MDFGDYIAQNREKKRQEGMEATSLRKLMSIYDPEGKDQYTSMGLGELRGSAQAIAVKQHLEQLQREEEARTAERNFYDVLGNVPGGVGPAAPLTGERMLSAAAQSNYRLPPQVLTQMMRDGEDGGGWKLDPSQIRDLSPYGLTGKFYVPTSKGGGSIQSNFDPSTGGIEEMQDEQGNSYKFITNPKTGARTIISRPKQAALSTSFLERLTGAEGLATKLQDARTRAKYSDAEAKLTAEATGLTAAQYRQKHSAAAAQLEQELSNLFDVAEAEGNGAPETWAKLRKQYGLPNPKSNGGGMATPPATAKAKPGNYPRAINPKTGETRIYKDDKWQKE